MFTNSSAADHNFKTFEVAFTKRPSQGWQLGASYSITWLNTAIGCNAAGAGLGVTDNTVYYPVRCATNPNQAFNTANNTRASANYDIRSGIPQARQVLFRGGKTITSYVLNVEPRGSFYLPNTHELDVRAAKRVNLGGARSMELRFDIYNALNKGTVRTWTLRSGPDFLRPITIMHPRIVQVGATFNF